MATPARTVATHITKDPGVCGGKACIDYTRIRVVDIVLLQRQDLKPEDMIGYFSVPLSLAQIHGALAYYYDHREEIEGDISDGRRVEAEIARDRGVHLKNRSGR